VQPRSQSKKSSLSFLTFFLLKLKHAFYRQELQIFFTKNKNFRIKGSMKK
jgi:hypothetical protein